MFSGFIENDQWHEMSYTETLALHGHKLRIREVDGGIFIHFNDETA